MTKNIKLIALDLDGTCLTENGIITDGTMEAVRRAGEAGFVIVIATGRPFQGIDEELLLLPGVKYAVVQNGSRIYDVEQQRTVFTQGMDVAVLQTIKEIAQSCRAVVDLYTDNRVICDMETYQHAEQYLKNQSFLEYYKRTRSPIRHLWQQEISQYHPVEKVTMYFADDGEKQQVRKRLEHLPDTKLCAGLDFNLELTHRDVDKANALRYIVDREGISMEEILACGDSGNDYEMIRQAGIGVAMGNAVDFLKKAADFVSCSNEEDGVAFALQRFLKIDR